MNAIRTLTLALSTTTLAAVGCGSDPGFTDDGAGGGDTTVKLDTAAKIEGFLDAKPLLMDGANIPTHPNGYDANANLGSASQCYHSTEMTLTGANFHVKSVLGTLTGAPNTGDVGMCDEATAGMALDFNSTSYVMENIQGDAACFDITITYNGFGQEGRGALSADRKTLKLELFFKDKATGIRCADGFPGSGGVTLSGAPFTGNAVQTYIIGTAP